VVCVCLFVMFMNFFCCVVVCGGVFLWWGGGGGKFNPPPPEIPKALQIRTKPNPIVKTAKIA